MLPKTVVLRTVRYTRPPGRILLRANSTSTPAPTSPSPLTRPTHRIRNGVFGTALLAALGFGYVEATDSRSQVHTYIVPPLIRQIFSGNDINRLGPEAAHAFGLRSLQVLYNLGIPIRERGVPPYLPQLHTTLFGRTINTPLGIAAGLDKHGEAIDALFTLSPAISIIEVGCVTPRPQPGNPKPRVFRLPTSEALINRYGFNSIGADAVARRLRDRVRRYAYDHGLTEETVLNSADIPASLHEGRILAVQIGKNKDTPETDIAAVKKDYVECVEKLGKYADVVVVNVSSPNTPGLRSLQAAAPLKEVLGAVVQAAGKVDRRQKPAVVVKVSPDSDEPRQVAAICEAVKSVGIKGIIVANTTVRRPQQLLESPQVTVEEKRVASEEAGGLSGPVLLPRMLNLVKEYRRVLGPQVEILACGGVRTGADAMAAVERGASAVLGYTGMVYGGVGWHARIAEELARINQQRKTSARSG